ncbi:MAG: OmpA family protein, partial [Deltaproteobacteria bacterium]|nr:OmpA family protein [Deltaproteobacteria bacterium]
TGGGATGGGAGGGATGGGAAGGGAAGGGAGGGAGHGAAGGVDDNAGASGGAGGGGDNAGAGRNGVAEPAGARGPRRYTIDEAAQDPEKFFSRCGRPLFLSGDLLFPIDDDALRPESRPLLGRLARLLKKAPDDNRILVVTGHADPRGEDDYNDQLSRARARRVAAALVAQGGIGADRVVVVGRGEREPIVARDAPDDLQRFNRRVELAVQCPSPGARP